MDKGSLIGVIVGAIGLVIGLAGAYYFVVSRRQSALRNLMQSSSPFGGAANSEIRERLRNDLTGEEFERLKDETRAAASQGQKLTLEDRFFRAGMFSPEEKAEFHRLRIIAPIVATVVFGAVGMYIGVKFLIIGSIFGLMVGFQLPMSILDRKAKGRDEDIMFYLPLVIEQIAIGVSSSLDIGPCIARVVSMADERDSHNVVTEFLRQSQYHVKSGVSLEAALTEIGIRSGHTELKHAFMSLSQVAKHGGEITRQLQELADAVAAQRETRIEAKIKKLELEATGPVALVFFGFLIILLVGFGLQIKVAFN